MVDTPAGGGHVVARIIVGVGYVVAGLFVLLAQIEDLTVVWSIIAPAAVVVIGVGLLVTGVVDSRLHGQKHAKEVST
jgi:uncharacterized membrane protein